MLDSHLTEYIKEGEAIASSLLKRGYVTSFISSAKEIIMRTKSFKQRKMVSLNLDQDYIETLDHYAKEHGYSNRSEFIRHLIFLGLATYK